MGSRVESLLMTNYNAPRFGGIRGVDTIPVEESCAEEEGSAGMEAAAGGSLQR